MKLEYTITEQDLDAALRDKGPRPRCVLEVAALRGLDEERPWVRDIAVSGASYAAIRILSTSGTVKDFTLDLVTNIVRGYFDEDNMDELRKLLPHPVTLREAREAS